MKSRPSVLFIGGYGRSGSTLLDVLLDRVPGMVSVGEFRHLFGRGLIDNELCSCGVPMRDCEFWGEVLHVAFPNGFDVRRVESAMRRITSLRTVPNIARSRLGSGRLRDDAKVYGDTTKAVYQAVLEVSGAEVVVDSTKYPVHGLFLKAYEKVDLSTVLLVRDPRGVAHSWRRRRKRPEVHWEDREMPRHSVVRSSLAWLVSNTLTSALDDGETPFEVHRYEDLTRDPIVTVNRIASLALRRDMGLTTSIFDRNRQMHTVAGNPLRLQQHRIEISPDVKWANEMPLHQQLLVSALCFRQMSRFSYPLKPQTSVA